MGKLGVFPASGQLGTSIRNDLLNFINPNDLVLVSRYPDKTPPHFSKAGVTLRKGDYDDPEGLGTAFADISHLILISAPSIEVEYRNQVRDNKTHSHSVPTLRKTAYSPHPHRCPFQV